jgi:hypothetical protein
MAANITLNENYVFYNNVATTDETDTCIMEVVENASTMMLEFNINDGGTFGASVYGAIVDKNHFKLIPIERQPDGVTLCGHTLSVFPNDSNFYKVDLITYDYIKIVLDSLSGTITVRAKVVG